MRAGTIISATLTLFAVARPVAAQPPTFTRDVAPLVWSRCAGCHRAGAVGPFSLITYDEVKRRATTIAAVVAKGVMPPWKPVPGYGDFADARRLTEPERTLLRQWIDAGAPEGNPADLPRVPSWATGWQLGRPDLVVTLPAAYTVPADGAAYRRNPENPLNAPNLRDNDVFRTFVVPIPVDRTRYVRAIEFRPDNARVVHHANIGIDRTRSSRQLDARDAEPGYAGGMVQDARYPEGQLLGWTPGQAPHAAPPGMQWRLEPSSDLVVQLHLQPTGKRETLGFSVGFFFTDEPPARTPVGLRLGSETIDIGPGDARYVVQDQYVLPVDVEVLAVQPHAHNLARWMEASATRPDGTVVPLIRIDDWDFRWQDVYRYARPIALARGTRIAMRYTYDNSTSNPRNPSRPPGRVVWGQNTTDEMGDLWIQVAPLQPSDVTTLTQDFRRKAHAEDLAAYTKLLRSDPDNPLRHDAVAGLYFEAGDIDAAIRHYERSLELNPASAITQYNLGIALAGRGRRDDALAHFQEAVRLDPDYAQAHNNLGAVLYVLGRRSEAVDHYRRAIALGPDNVDARTNLGVALSELGRAQDAVVQFREALALRPDSAAALGGLAWIRATASDPALRNGTEAVALAERAATATGRRDLSVLDALAAAYAEAGRFDDAAAVAREAVNQAANAGLAAVADRFRDRLKRYQQRKPYRLEPEK